MAGANAKCRLLTLSVLLVAACIPSAVGPGDAGNDAGTSCADAGDARWTSSVLASGLNFVLGKGGGIALSDAGYLVVSSAEQILKVFSDGGVEVLAGDGNGGYLDGPASAAEFFLPSALALGPQGTIFVADGCNDAVRAIDPGGNVSTIASGIMGQRCGLPKYQPFLLESLAVDRSGGIFLAAWNRPNIYTVALDGGVALVASDGGAATFGDIWGLAMEPGGSLLVADGSAVDRVNPDGTVTTIAGGDHIFSLINKIAVGPSGGVYIQEGMTLHRVDPEGGVSTIATEVENCPGLPETIGPGMVVTASDIFLPSESSLFQFHLLAGSL